MTTNLLYCPYCGAKLKILNNRDYCITCGFVEEEKRNSDETPSYVG